MLDLRRSRILAALAAHRYDEIPALQKNADPLEAAPIAYESEAKSITKKDKPCKNVRALRSVHDGGLRRCGDIGAEERKLTFEM